MKRVKWWVNSKTKFEECLVLCSCRSRMSCLFGGDSMEDCLMNVEWDCCKDFQFCWKDSWQLSWYFRGIYLLLFAEPGFSPDWWKMFLPRLLCHILSVTQKGHDRQPWLCLDCHKGPTCFVLQTTNVPEPNFLHSSCTCGVLSQLWCVVACFNSRLGTAVLLAVWFSLTSVPCRI